MKRSKIINLIPCFLIPFIFSGCGGGGGSGPTNTQPAVVSYTIGGTISGLSTGAQVVLNDNGSDPLTVSANGTFTFPTSLTANGNYAVTVATQPTHEVCTVSNGSGSNVAANISNIAVTCSTNIYTISGTVTGLGSGDSVTLNNNGADQTTVTSNSSFTFTTPVAYGGDYSVSVVTQPLAQICSVKSGSGTNVTANITNVNIVCSVATEVVLHTFTGGTSDGSFPNGSLTLGTDGNFYGLTPLGGTNGNGTIFKMTPSGVVTIIYSFAGGTTDGQYPANSLTLGSDGNFYGMTSEGGENELGTIFKVTPAGVETMLHSFAGGTTDGANPGFGNLTLGPDGNFYGMTTSGGAHSLGTVFKMTPDGIETVLYSFAGGTTDGATPYSSLTLGSDGNFYGMTSEGGAGAAGTVFKVTPAGIETVLHSFGVTTTDGATPLASLTLGNDGNFYGTTEAGGVNAEGTFFKITPAGIETVLYSFGNGASDGYVPNSSLTLGSDGNFYGITCNGGTSDLGTIYKISPEGVETVLYSFDGTASQGAINENLTLGRDGNFYGMSLEDGASRMGTIFRF